ncbi:Glutamate receptor 2.7 [Linum grandiflorum]
MVDHFQLVLVAIIATTFLVTTFTSADAATSTRIGAIVDETCRIGKEQTLAMQMAVQDLHDSTNKSLVLHLHIKNSSGEPLQAALSARELVMNSQVNAIVGPSSWEETSLVAEIGSKSQIPILSLSDSTPKWARQRWPFLVQFSSSKSAQMKAIASIIHAFGWHQVSVICEDLESSTKAVLQLSDALRQANLEIVDVVTLPPFSTSSSLLYNKLETLRIRPCRVFVVHISSSTLAARLFKKAKDMKMMERDYVWIATQRLQSFYKRFRGRFSLVHPDEHSHEHGIFAIEAYDAIWTLGLSLLRDSNTKGQDLLNKLLASNFNGLLNGNVQFTMQMENPVSTFEIINVIGKSYTELGFWSTGQGFSDRVSSKNATFFSSMRDISMSMGQVVWPGRPWYIPRGWAPSPIDEPLRIGVPTESIFKQFVDVEFDPSRNTMVSVKGYAIELFEKAVEHLPFYLPYKFIPFNGTYTALVQQIYLKNVEVAVGDIAIVTSRLPYADFTHPCTESQLVMIVPLQSKKVNRAWLITKPFTTSLWLLILILNLYNGYVVWMIERDQSLDPKGSLAFAKGSPWLPYITEALVKVTESGKLRDLERDMIASQKCIGNDLFGNSDSIGADSFWMLFIFTAGTSTLALLIFLFCCKDHIDDSSSDLVK